MKKRLFTRPLVSLCALSLALAACSFTPKAAVEHISLTAQLGANGNHATAVDFVFIYDTAAETLLPQSGLEWFAGKSALLANLANRVDVVSLQVPPAQQWNVSLPKRHHKAVGVFSFANTLNKDGQARTTLTPYRRVSMVLAPDTVLFENE